MTRQQRRNRLVLAVCAFAAICWCCMYALNAAAGTGT